MLPRKSNFQGGYVATLSIDITAESPRLASVSRLTFFTLSLLTTRLIQKSVQNIISFVVAWCMNENSLRMT